MKTTGNEIVSLLHTPMTDIKMIEMIDSLGLEQPIIDEQYEIDLDVSTNYDKNTEVILTFKEIEGITSNGEPSLSQVSFKNDNNTEAPFGLSFKDDYKLCCSKLGAKANFQFKKMRGLKVWLVNGEKELVYSVAIFFKGKELDEMRSIVVTVFDKNADDKTLVENKE